MGRKTTGLSVIAVISYTLIAALLFSSCSTLLLSAFDTTTAGTVSIPFAQQPQQQGGTRDILRVFEGRGAQGLPFLNAMTGAFIDPTASTQATADLIAYAYDVALPALAGILLGAICLIVSCFIWYARCCCDCCCKGDPDPESKHVPVRIIVAILSAVAFCGAIIGLVGGVVMSNAIRSFMTNAITIGNTLAINLATVNNIGVSIGISPATIQQFDTIITQANGLLRSVNVIITPFDVARMFILYVGMALALLAAVTLGVGVVLRRKQITSTGYVCAAIALVVSWFIFGVNLPMAILFDDACVTAETLFAANSGGQISFLLQCTDTQTSHDGIEQIVVFSSSVYAQIANQAQQINAQSGMQTYSAAVLGWTQQTLRQACPQQGMFWSRADALCIAARVRSDYLLVDPQFQACDAQGTACHGGIASHQALSTAIPSLLQIATGLDAVNVLIDCATINGLLDLFRLNICQTLIIGILLVFVGALVIGLPLIPAVLLALWVGQKFPNRAAAARLKSRLMVIFSFQFFNGIVSLAGELRTTGAEIALSAVTIVIGAAGFAFLNIPMNRLNWSPTAQMWLSAVLAAMELGIGGGWIWYLLQQAGRAEICVSVVFQQSLQMGMFVLPTANSASPCWDNTYLSHTLVSTILAAVATIMCVLGAVTAIILLVKIKCGYSLNLQDSDYEVETTLTLTLTQT